MLVLIRRDDRVERSGCCVILYSATNSEEEGLADDPSYKVGHFLPSEIGCARMDGDKNFLALTSSLRLVASLFLARPRKINKKLFSTSRST